MGITNYWGKDANNSGGKLDPNAVAIPCGLIAKSYFNDTFVLNQKQGDGEYTDVELN